MMHTAGDDCEVVQHHFYPTRKEHCLKSARRFEVQLMGSIHAWLWLCREHAESMGYVWKMGERP
jgi:hypothetical protein